MQVNNQELFQEWFDKAWNGLKSQNFERCMEYIYDTSGALDDTRCSYSHEDMRCAWGWVDQSLTGSEKGGVDKLRDMKIGIAANLNDDQIHFAQRLQSAHDSARHSESMQNFLVEIAKDYKLTIPWE